ncbi:helix-turn-helix domain-containing protein [Vibrio lentus]|uniref:helix-turn-helix domain-containing protein n=1 Tax=Vibrio lentus TaxID=136468 RepID=UPI0007EE9B52|nr:helix-turn-helix transcriptional regulator [Vibrio lentus]OBT22340.1 transcriptional regulator [Vibrio tasmaniensis]PMH13130.1 transcriptional regulator [Vibrio lentus]PMI64058.1 transcriptional regulator [Vibrio lentus]PMJ13180.1 transcriptional regulator [Vibrio lentus]PMN07095.1 transcriptional regulator [Vibrio lentus]
MFGDYLKELRLSLGLTQSELAVKLNLADEEFRSLDVVTLSRWERGKTKPTLAKCLRILRCLQIDLSRFYDLIPNPNETKLLDKFVKLRFDNRIVKLSSLSYEAYEKPQISLVTELPLLLKDDDNVLYKLKAFYKIAIHNPKGLFDINLYEYQQSKRAIFKRFTAQNDNLIGHSLSFIFESEYFDKAIHSKNFDIDLSNSVSYKNTAKLAVFNYHRYSSSFEVFRCVFVSQYINLIRHSNVQRYYFFNPLPESEPLLEQLGFEKVAFDVESNTGGFKLGARSFERCLYEIDAATLLSQPEIITLIKTTQWNNQYSNKSN